MATLTETAYYTRSFIKYGAILIVFLILARITWVVGTGLYLRFFPPPPPPPQVAFGKLPALPFPEQEAGPQTNLIVQTATGSFPELPSQTLVYFMPQATSSLLALDEATSLAESLDFPDNRHMLNDTIYRYERANTPIYLDVNIVNKTFSVNYDLTQSPEILQTRPQSTSEALQAATSFVSFSGVYADDLAQGTKTFEFLKIQDNEFVSTLSLSEAQFVRVNFFRRDYNELPVVTSNKRDANVWFLVTGENTQDKEIIAGEFHYFPVDEERNSTYPLRPVAQAFEELKAGNGFIAQAAQQDVQIAVRRIYLAYYDSGRPQEFLQPIYVFEGDGGFIGYVPAVSPEYYGGSTTPTVAPEASQEQPATESAQ